MAQAARSPSARAEACPERRAILCHSMAFQALYAKASFLQSTECHTSSLRSGERNAAHNLWYILLEAKAQAACIRMAL